MDQIKEWATPQVLLAVYAALMSTFVFLWNVRESLKKQKGNLKVSADYYMSFIADGFGNEIGGTHAIIRIKITNIGISKRFIECPAVEFKKGVCGVKIFKYAKMAELEQFPLEIDTGDIYETEIELRSLVNNFTGEFEIKNNDRFKILVSDTLGKEYRSPKSFKMKQVMKNLIAAKAV